LNYDGCLGAVRGSYDRLPDLLDVPEPLVVREQQTGIVAEVVENVVRTNHSGNGQELPTSERRYTAQDDLWHIEQCRESPSGKQARARNEASIFETESDKPLPLNRDRPHIHMDRGVNAGLKIKHDFLLLTDVDGC
jgi:hypothetical protein